MDFAGEFEGSEFLRLLRSGAASGDYSAAAALVRSMPPTGIDREIRSMAVLGGADAPASETADVGFLFDFLEGEVASNHDFEFFQAVLRLTLQVNPRPQILNP